MRFSTPRSTVSFSRVALAFAALAICAACGPPSIPANNAAAGPSASEQAYHAAPELTGAAMAGGQVELAGVATPGAAVRLATPEGAAAFATANGQGAWRLAVPSSPAPRLFGLSMSDNGRLVQAMGYLFVAPGAVARLRAGGGTESLAAAPHGLAPLTLDYDGQRAVTLSGRATPAEALTLRVDGVERAQGQADGAGRFTLALIQPLAAGAHDFDLAGAAGDVRFSAAVGGPAPLAHAPFSARREGAAWRIDWVTPGGGEQTTLVFDPMAAPS